MKELKTHEEMLARADELVAEGQHITATYLRLHVELGVEWGDGDDHLIHHAIVRTIRDLWGTPAFEQIMFPALFTAIVQKCGSQDPNDFIIMALSGCDDGDICIAIAQADAYQCTYLANSHSRRYRQQWKLDELKLVGQLLMPRLQHVERGKWLEALQADAEVLNQFLAEVDMEIRKAQGKPTDA